MVKQRQSNIELLRNISMFLILVIHANFVSLPKIEYGELMNNATPSIVRFFIESIGIVAVDAFVFISGWFGVNAKLKSVLSFLYLIFFFWAGGGILFLILGKETFNVEWLLNTLQLSGSDWFIKSYFVLMIIAPILNAYSKTVEEKTQRVVMVSFFMFEAIFGWVAGGRRFFVEGYSPLHFIGLYITAQYIHYQLQKDTAPHWIKRLFQMPKWADLLVFFVIASVNTLFVVFGTIILGNARPIRIVAYAYSNPLIILGALYLFLFFSKIKMPYVKIINWLGASSFAVYLFHGQSTIISSFFTPNIIYIYDSYSGISCVFFIFLFLCIVYLISVVIDQLRIFSWGIIWNHSNRNDNSISKGK